MGRSRGAAGVTRRLVAFGLNPRGQRKPRGQSKNIPATRRQRPTLPRKTQQWRKEKAHDSATCSRKPQRFGGSDHPPGPISAGYSGHVNRTCQGSERLPPHKACAIQRCVPGRFNMSLRQFLADLDCSSSKKGRSCRPPPHPFGSRSAVQRGDTVSVQTTSAGF